MKRLIVTPVLLSFLLSGKIQQIVLSLTTIFKRRSLSCLSACVSKTKYEMNLKVSPGESERRRNRKKMNCNNGEQYRSRDYRCLQMLLLSDPLFASCLYFISFYLKLDEPMFIIHYKYLNIFIYIYIFVCVCMKCLARFIFLRFLV